MTTFDAFEDACRGSKARLAVSVETFRVDYHGMRREIELIKPLYGDAYAVLRGGAIRLRDYKPPTFLVDSVKRWKPYV